MAWRLVIPIALAVAVLFAALTVSAPASPPPQVKVDAPGR
jgi:hypothetical protein